MDVFKNRFYCLLALDKSDGDFSRYCSHRYVMTSTLNWKTNGNF